MPLLDSVPITSCRECVVQLTLPLALFLMLAELTAGGMATVAYLRLTGGLTHGYLKFVTATYAILGILAFLVIVAGPPGLHDQLLSVNQPAASALVFLQGVLVVALSNRPLLRAIGVLLVSLILQAVLFPLTLRGLAHGSGSLTHALTLSPVLSVLWALGAVFLPLVAAGLAWPTCRLRSFMSTTGLLYLAMIAILPGQLLGQLLFFVAASA